MMRLVVAIALLALNSLACADNPSAPTDVPVGQPFDLEAGHAARVGADALIIRFDRVPQDSRCPVDVQCFVAGDATVRLVLSGAGAAEATVELHTNAEPRSTSRGRYEVELVDLKPVPRSNRPVPAADYVAVLRVTGP